MLAEILEIFMIVSFGFSWPLNVMKSFKARTANGKSLAFLLFIEFGYVCGITSKLVNENGFKWYVLFFYVLNFIMVGIDIALYFRNKAIDKKNGEK